MIAQQMTSNGTFLPKKTAHAHDDVICFDVIVRWKISKLCPPCQLVPTTPLQYSAVQCKYGGGLSCSTVEGYHIACGGYHAVQWRVRCKYGGGRWRVRSTVDALNTRYREASP